MITKCLRILLILACSLQACRNNPVKKPDPRPSDQRSFLKKLAVLDSAIQTVNNDIVRDELLDSSISAFSTYTADTLNKSFSNWEVEVYEITNEPLGFDVVQIELMMKHNPFDSQEYPEFSSPIFKATVLKSEKRIVDTMKKLSKFDKVVISGEFQYTKEGLKIDANTVSTSPAEIFENPIIDVTIKDIKTISPKL